jgi:ABC-type transporter Mla MlaB component
MATLALTGPVSLDSFADHRQQGEAAIAAAAGGTLTVDLGELASTSSLVVALLAAWYRAAEDAGCAVHFANLSADLRLIVEFSGLAGVLPIDGAAKR